VAASKGMCTRESNDFLIIKAGSLTYNLSGPQNNTNVYQHAPHAVEDISEVISTLSGIRETAIGCSMVRETIDATRTPWDVRTGHFLNGSDPCEGPEVTVAYPGELFLDLFHHTAGDLEACVGIVK